MLWYIGAIHICWLFRFRFFNGSTFWLNRLPSIPSMKVSFTMARIEGLGREALPANLSLLYRRFTAKDHDFTNQADVLAHSPAAFRHLYGLVEALKQDSTLPQRLIEIAVVTTSAVNACPYCVGHHATALIAQGLSAQTVAGILDDEPPGLTDKERLVRDYARLVTERAWGIRDHVIQELRRHFSDREIVELTVRVGLCGLFNKFNQALDINVEEDVAREIDTIRLKLPLAHHEEDDPQ